MLYDYSDTRELYVCFHDDTEYFGSAFIKRGFKHCFVIERQPLGWIVLDPSRSELSATILPARWDTDMMATFKANNSNVVVLKLYVKYTRTSNYPRPGINSCVGVVQYILGVYWPFTFTPYRLYNKLIKQTPPHIQVIDNDRFKSS